MKKLLYSTKAKVTAFIFIIIFSVTGVLSGIGSIYIYDEFYSGSIFSVSQPDYYYSSFFYKAADHTMQNVVDIFLTEEEPTYVISSTYSPNYHNAAFQITYNIGKLKSYYSAVSLSSDLVERYHDTYSITTDYYFGKTHSHREKITIEVSIYLPHNITAHDEFYYGMRLYYFLFSYRYWVFAAFAVSLLFALLLIIFLLCAAGHKKGHEEIVLNRYDRIPLEIIGLFVLLPLAFAIELMTIPALAVSAIMLLLFLQSFAARLKAGKWYRSTLIFKILRFFKRLFPKILKLLTKLFSLIPSVWKAGLIFFAYLFTNFLISLMILASHGFFLFILMLISFNLFAFAAFCLLALNLQKIKKMSKSISEGNFNDKASTANLLFDFKDIADNLNNISKANLVAIEAARKSERMKAELITNVSHDIKTPLTSIINYVDLLKKESVQGERAQEYIEVIDRQSARLKKMTTDLIDASKASTGNIDVKFSPIDISEFINQAAGEYSEKLAENSLELILSVPESPIYISADGKLLWRIIDNLLGNACKYSQENTRVYVSVGRQKDSAVISVKNISRDVLNVSADELTERFVRGDSSRNTEGSGLGLSIAKSLAALLKGELNIDIECDLFRAEVIFPELHAPNKEGL